MRIEGEIVMKFKVKLLSLIILFVLVLLTACTAGRTDDVNDCPPENNAATQVETEPLQADVYAAEDICLEEFVNGYIQRYGDIVGGLAVSVFTRDDMILELRRGYANEAAGLPVDSDTVFEWGSMTKMLVGISALQLYERGELDLHADIFDFISAEDFPNIIHPTTMFHLLHHTAGFSELWWPQESVERYTMLPQDEIALSLGDSLRELAVKEFFAQNRPPGQLALYSAYYGISLAGYVIETISGIPFYQYVHDYIFAPLNMSRTALRPDLSDNEWVRAQRDAAQSLYYPRLAVNLYPTGSTVGTVADMIRFARALIPDENGNSPLFERAETVQKLFDYRYAVPVSAFTDNSYINAFNMIPFGDEPVRVFGHGGHAIGFRARLYVDIAGGVGMVVCENRSFGMVANSGFIENFKEAVFGYERAVGSQRANVLVNVAHDDTWRESETAYELTPWPGPAPEIGGVIEFGGFDWRVLDMQDGKALILSEHTVAFMPYHIFMGPMRTSWEESGVNQFLNREFYRRFAGYERVRIAETLIATDGGYTAGKLFLLSIEEVLTYFGGDACGQMSGVFPPLFIDDEYNAARAAFKAFGTASSWWLRSLNESSRYAPWVMTDGIIAVQGELIVFNSRGVRPAMWIYL